MIAAYPYPNWPANASARFLTENGNVLYQQKGRCKTGNYTHWYLASPDGCIIDQDRLVNDLMLRQEIMLFASLKDAISAHIGAEE